METLEQLFFSARLNHDQSSIGTLGLPFYNLVVTSFFHQIKMQKQDALSILFRTILWWWWPLDISSLLQLAPSGMGGACGSHQASM
jgi:hypothetical protein